VQSRNNTRGGAELLEQLSRDGGLTLYRRYRFKGSPSGNISAQDRDANFVREKELRKVRNAMK
jgi:hypothetical protein